MSTFGERLREERNRLGLSQIAFAKLGGAKKHSQINYEADKSSPSSEYLAALAQHDVDVLYVLTGIRTPALPPAVAAAQRFVPPDLDDRLRRARIVDAARCPEYVQDSGLFRLALFDIDDTGALAPSHDPAAIVALAADWFDARDIDPGKCGLVRSPEVDMTPVVPHEALVVVHFGADLPAWPVICALVLDGRLRLRRVQARARDEAGAPTSLALSSETHAAPPLLLGPDDLHRLTLAGRVRAVISNVD